MILAGGSGVRFWPLSRELSPKQLLTTFGTDTLISQAIQRVQPFIAARPHALRIVTNERLGASISEYLAEAGMPFDDAVNLLVEPAGRNTAPAIALTAAALLREDPEAVMLVLPSDHVMEEGTAWQEIVAVAAQMAYDGWLVTIGLQPTRPESGFGYIRTGEPLAQYARSMVHPVMAGCFIEKPDVEMAEHLIINGDALWNAGILCLRADAALEGLCRADRPEIADTCRRIAALPAATWMRDDRVRAWFAALPSISIDHALLEHAPNVAVIPTALGWNDVGSLQALASLAPPDASGNIRLARGVDIDSHDVTVYAADRLIATLGIADAIIVDTADATLVCHQDRCQDVRRVVDALKAQGETHEVVEPSTSLRVWGQWTTILRGEGFLIKSIEVHPGAVTGAHLHTRRNECWVVVAGVARVHRDGEYLLLGRNESLHMLPGVVHALENAGDTPLKVIEVQVGEALGEADIRRVAAQLE